MNRPDQARPRRKRHTGAIVFTIWVALVMAGVAGLLLSVPRARTFTGVNEYDRIHNRLAANPAVAAFPPAGTAFAPGSAFHARIVPMQGSDDIWLFVPGAALVPAPQASGQPPSDFALSRARDALNALAPRLDFDAGSASVTVLFADHASFTVLWQDHATGDRLFVALLD